MTLLKSPNPFNCIYIWLVAAATHVKCKRDIWYVSSALKILKKVKNKGTEEIDLKSVPNHSGKGFT